MVGLFLSVETRDDVYSVTNGIEVQSKFTIPRLAVLLVSEQQGTLFIPTMIVNT